MVATKSEGDAGDETRRDYGDNKRVALRLLYVRVRVHNKTTDFTGCGACSMGSSELKEGHFSPEKMFHLTMLKVHVVKLITYSQQTISMSTTMISTLTTNNTAQEIT